MFDYFTHSSFGSERDLLGVQVPSKVGSAPPKPKKTNVGPKGHSFRAARRAVSAYLSTRQLLFSKSPSRWPTGIPFDH
jgi:hypothetical protein